MNTPIAALARLLLLGVSAAVAGCKAPLPPADPRPASGSVVVVANQEHGVATIVDVAEWRIVAHVDVRMTPHEGAPSSDGRFVALASPSTWRGDAQQIALLDVQSPTLARTLDLGSFRWPHGLAFVDARTLVVSSRAQGGIAFVDVETGQLTTSAQAAGSQPYLLHVAGSTGRIYTSSPATNTISEYDLKGRTFLRDLHVPDQPAGFSVSPDGQTLWISTSPAKDHGKIVVMDAPSGTVKGGLAVPGHGRRLAFAGADRVLVTEILHDSVSAFDAVAVREIGRIDLGQGTAPSGISCDTSSRRCYVATLRSGELVEIDADRLQVLRRIQVGEGADGVVLVKR